MQITLLFINRLENSLPKHAYSNILKILQQKKGNFSDKKNLIFFHISAQTSIVGTR